MTWSPGRRIAELVRLGRDLRYWIGVPVASPVKWSEVFRVESGEIATVTGESCRLDDVRFWLSAYRNGEVFECEGDLPAVPGIHGLEKPKLPAPETIRESDVRMGMQWAVVAHGPCPLPWRGPHHFATQVLNVSSEPIRITGFAPYAWIKSMGIVTTIRFTAAQFRAWYDLGAEEWIAPGARAWDLANYSDPGLLWAYHGETRSGVKFVTGAIAP